jgi:putative membrane protein
MFYMHNFGWGWWLVMTIGMVAFWALVIFGIVWLVHGGQNTQRRDEPPRDSPKELLERRLAQGEISVDEYRRLLDALDDHHPPHSMAA